MPLQRRLPKRGFINRFRIEPSIVNVRDLNRFESGSVVGPEEFIAQRLIHTTKHGVKLLAFGDLDRALTVKVHACSRAAQQKIVAAGGTLELLDHRGQPDSSVQETE